MRQFGNPFKMMVRWLLGALVMVQSVACTPTCEQTCKKLLNCEESGLESPLLNLDECTSACAAQSNWYDDTENQENIDAFDALKRCIYSETCEDLQTGVCYDEDVYIW